MGSNKSKPEYFDISKAKKLVKKCLSKDLLYNKFLDSIMKFDKHDFEQLFIGNTKIKYNIAYDYDEFSYLVHKFQDYNKIMFFWHKQKYKFDELALLWQKDVCISKLYDLSQEEKEEELSGLSFNFKSDLLDFLNETIESKTDGIISYIKEKCSNVYSLIENLLSGKKQVDKQKIDNNNGNYCKNLLEMSKYLILECAPVLVEYYNSLPNLDPLSKMEIKEGITDKLGKLILNKIAQKNPNSFVHNKLLNLAKKFKNGEMFENIINKAANFYNHPIVFATHLAMSLLNLIHSIKSFIDCREKFNKEYIKYSRDFSKICTDFESHKNELPKINLNNVEEAREKIKDIQNKILQDKSKLISLINRLKITISEKEKEKTKTGVCIALNCVGIVSAAIGTVLSGGLLAPLYGGLIGLNASSLVINSVNIVKIKEELEKCNKMLEMGINKQNEISNLIDLIKDKYNIS